MPVTITTTVPPAPAADPSDVSLTTAVPSPPLAPSPKAGSGAAAPQCGTRVADSMARLLSATSAVDRRFEHVSIACPRLDGAEPVVSTTSVAHTMAVGQMVRAAGALEEVLRTGLPVIVTAADRASRFPAMRATAAALGVDLQLAVPLLSGGRATGGLSVYSTAEAEVDMSMLDLAEALAAQAALLLDQDRLISDLRVGLTTRQLIGQACGILMSRFVLDDEQAFAALRQASQNRNVKVRDLAGEVTRTGTLTELDGRGR